MSCGDLESALDFYTGQLGFRLDLIYPADAPRVAELSGYGIHVRLERDKVVQQNHDGEWSTGRAGMQYRDLIPDRCGGRYIASHIRIPVGGPVPDYVHHHDVDFQMIYCYRGWVKVVYEDQGPPFVLEAGDCVLQPPHIRHRVLECSDHMEVIEVSSPAEHETRVDHDMDLPTAEFNMTRSYGGQQFVRHQADKATWTPGPYKGVEARDTGIGQATSGLASVMVLRPTVPAEPVAIRRDAKFVFNFVLQGSMTLLQEDASSQDFTAGDSFVIASDSTATIVDSSENLELLHVVSNHGSTGASSDDRLATPP